MKLKILAGAVALAGLASTPSLALTCFNEGPKAPDIEVYQGGEWHTQTDTEAQQRLDKQRLRNSGVDADSVERWSGCLRAYVVEDGKQSMQFYDPVTLQRLQ